MSAVLEGVIMKSKLLGLMAVVRKQVLVAIIGVVATGLAYLINQPAQAMGLDGSTVAVYAFFPAQTVAPPISPDCTTYQYCETPNYPIPPPGNSQNYPYPIVPVNFLEDALTLTTISVANTPITQIVITNDSALPFCTVSGPCPDPFDGFEFVFSAGVDISGVTASGDADFQPISGGLNFTPTIITVNLAGDAPQIGDQLILDLTFPTTATPLPAALPLFATGLGALGLLGWRRKRKNAAAIAAA